MASVAPLGAALAIWAVTGSAFALVFGLLGPVIAAATILDARRVDRRRLRAETGDWLRARGALHDTISERHRSARESGWSRTPPASTILAGRASPTGWGPDQAPVVALGRGTVASDIILAGDAHDDVDAALLDWASRMRDGPVTADLGAGLGLAGPPPLTRAVARAVLVQLAHARAPAAMSISRMPSAGWEWATPLPHRVTQPSADCVISIVEAPEVVDPPNAAPGARGGTTSRTLLIALGGSPRELAPGCATVVHITGPDHAEVIRSPVHRIGLDFRPELVTEAEAARFFKALALAGARAGQGPVRALPDRVALADLLPRAGSHAAVSPGATTSTLACPVGVGLSPGEGSGGGTSVVVLDLVEAGPHAVIGGTTGSGKSELLVTWVVSMAAGYTAEQVTFLLVDFKGGAAFAPLADLPHCVGLLTDLDESQAARALASLRAELRFREATLRDAGARDITEASAVFPRLVIVVDEFQAMMDTFPALHGLFVSLAARGRSLGIHLVLCTQRPAGVVHDALLANCSLRLSLRVNNRADSLAVIGTDAASSIPRSRPGRCLVGSTDNGTDNGTDIGTDSIQACQIATTTGEDIARLIRHRPGGQGPRRPWLDPLPRILRNEDLLRVAQGPVADDVLGLVDEPQNQRYRVATWDPRRHGHLLVLGDAGSGKSSVLRLVSENAAYASRYVPADVEAAWDALEAARTFAERASTPGARDEAGYPLLLLDDLDAVVGRWDAEYQLAALETLTGLLRTGSVSGIGVVIAVQRLVGPLRQSATLCASTLLLGLGNRDEYRAAGGLDALFDPALHPGAGLWQGARIQVVAPGAGPIPGERTDPIAAGVDTVPLLDVGTRSLVVVSSVPAETVRRLSAHTRAPRVVDITGSGSPAGESPLTIDDSAPGTLIIGTPEAWLQRWALLTALRPAATLVFDRCSTSEFRRLSGLRQLPPALASGRGHVWTLSPEGVSGRAALPPV